MKGNHTPKKIGATVVLALGLGVSNIAAAAVGLGPIAVNSYIGQPLRASIRLNGISASEAASAVVTLAPASEYSKRNVVRTADQSALNFRVVRRGSGYVIAVSSSKRVTEPFINFVLQIKSGGTTVVREYSAFLDQDPAVAAGIVSAVPETPAAAAAPAAKPVHKNNRNIALQPASEQTQGWGVPAAQAAQPAPAAKPAATPKERTSARRERHAARQKASPAPRHTYSGSSYGPVKRGETLYAIADEVRPSNVSVATMQRALFNANRRAFVRNSMDSLMAGVTLVIPRDIAAAAAARSESPDVKKSRDSNHKDSKAKANEKNNSKFIEVTAEKAPPKTDSKLAPVLEKEAEKEGVRPAVMTEEQAAAEAKKAEEAKAKTETAKEVKAEAPAQSGMQIDGVDSIDAAQKQAAKQPAAEQKTQQQEAEKKPKAKPAAEKKPEANKPAAEKKPEANKPAAEKKPEANKPAAEKKPEANKPAAEKKPEANKPAAEKKPEANKPASEKKPEANKPAAEKKPEANKPVAEKKPEANKPAAEKKSEVKKPAAEKPAASENSDLPFGLQLWHLLAAGGGLLVLLLGALVLKSKRKTPKISLSDEEIDELARSMGDTEAGQNLAASLDEKNDSLSADDLTAVEDVIAADMDRTAEAAGIAPLANQEDFFDAEESLEKAAASNEVVNDTFEDNSASFFDEFNIDEKKQDAAQSNPELSDAEDAFFENIDTEESSTASSDENIHFDELDDFFAEAEKEKTVDVTQDMEPLQAGKEDEFTDLNEFFSTAEVQGKETAVTSDDFFAVQDDSKQPSSAAETTDFSLEGDFFSDTPKAEEAPAAKEEDFFAGDKAADDNSGLDFFADNSKPDSDNSGLDFFSENASEKAASDSPIAEPAAETAPVSMEIKADDAPTFADTQAMDINIDLASAYIKSSVKPEKARALLEEVIIKGSPEQKTIAADMLKQLS